MFRKLCSIWFFILSPLILFAQAPDIIPYGNPKPLELNLFNIILFIVVPVIIFIVWFLYRRKNNRNRRGK